MDIFQLILWLVSISIAYIIGHWLGYGRGEQDTKELTEEITKLNQTKKEASLTALPNFKQVRKVR